MGNSTPGKSAFSRVFLIKGRARPDHEPDFQSCLKAGAVEQNFGDTERIECPDPQQYGNFIDVGEIQGQIERPALTLMGRYAADLASELLDLAKKRCPFDGHINFGACEDPRDNNSFTKKIIFESAKGGAYSTDELGALSSDENSAINETLEMTGSKFYEVLPLSFAEEAGDAVTNQLNDAIVCSIISCGDCEASDDGCDKVYAVGESAPGSPGTPPDVVYTNDNGVTWYASDIDTIAVGDGADGVACMGVYLVVVSEDEGSLHYILKTALDATPPLGGFTEITTGFVGVNYPQDIWSVGTYAFIVGLNGYIYGTGDPTGGVTVLDAGVATTENLEAVHAISETFAVAVGANATIVRTENQTSWGIVAGPTGVADNFTCVWVKNENEWFIGTDGGEVYYTLDGGTTWTEKVLPGINYDTINDIAFASDSVGYISALITNIALDNTGRILRTYDGGYSWVVEPEGVATMPANDNIIALAACPNDVNFVVGVGLADDAADGYLVVGRD